MTELYSLTFDPRLLAQIQTQTQPKLSREEKSDLVEEHAAEPIKDRETIQRIASYYLNRGELRNYTLFVVGTNVGLRISDLLKLRFQDVFNEDGTVKEEFPLKEKKTNKRRVIGLSERSKEALIAYRNSLSDYSP